MNRAPETRAWMNSSRLRTSTRTGRRPSGSPSRSRRSASTGSIEGIGGGKVIVASLQVDQCLASGDAGFQLVPPGHVGLAQAPAQPDLPSRDEGREVDQAGGDVAQRDLPAVDPDNPRLHLVDDALH